MAPTIKDVAALAGFSTATVSRTLNTPEAVSPETLARVQEAIGTLGYRPNPLGRQLRSDHTSLIGVVLPTLANPVFAECLQDIEEAAAAADYRLMLMTTRYAAERERSVIEALRNQRVDGLILTVANANQHPLLDELDRDGMPYVLMHNDTTLRPSVAVDNRLAAREGVRMLIAHGHRRILMLAGMLSASDRAQLRYAGYVDAMREAGLAPQTAIEIDFNAAALEPATQALLTGPQRPTALFCSNDLLAMLVMRDLQRAGLRVPQDMSILGFDGLAVGELLAPPLTSISTPNRAIGHTAWLQLMDRINAPPAPAGKNSRPPVVRLAHMLRAGATVATLAAPDANAAPSPTPA